MLYFPFCQIVPTSTNESELCINGMSFSKRSSRWANAALVVSVPSEDFEPLISEHGPLAGIAFQVRFSVEISSKVFPRVLLFF